GVEVLRGQIVRRLPTVTERSKRKPFALTPRDEQILAAVYQHGLLSTDQIELAFFPPADTSRRAPSSPAYQRLRHLWLWSYLDRIELPVARALGGRQPFLYALGARAVPVVGQRFDLGEQPVQRRRLERLDDVF